MNDCPDCRQLTGGDCGKHGPRLIPHSPTLGMVHLQADYQVSLEEMRLWPADDIEQFFRGLSMVAAVLERARRRLQ